jgi:hypothetical protein
MTVLSEIEASGASDRIAASLTPLRLIDSETIKRRRFGRGDDHG